MKLLHLSILILLSGLVFCQEGPIGSWREHLPYNSAIDLASANGKIYAATPFSLFSVDPSDKTIERLSKVTGLSETGISRIAANSEGDKLFIAYTNSNIDILYRNDIINIPDIREDNTPGDKSVYGIFPDANDFYLSTGLGIIVINGDRNEVRDTWKIGINGEPIRINGFTKDGSYFYAATIEGLKRAAINAGNLADHSNWTLLSGSAGLPAGECADIISVQGSLIAWKDDALYKLSGNNWSVLYQDAWPVVSINSSGGKITICQRRITGQSRVLIADINGNVERILAQPNVISFPKRAITVGTDVWIADQFGSLSDFSSSGFEQYKLNSPEGTASGEMLVVDQTFYATAGEVNDSWNYQYNGNGIFTLNAGTWNNINRYRYGALDSMLDFITIARDKSDQTTWAGSYGGGLLHITGEGQFTIYKQGILGQAIGDPGSYRVSGLAFDLDNNLWVSNYGAAQPLLARQSDGAWHSFTVPFTLNENALTQILVDDNNYKWIVGAKGSGLLCFDHGSAIDNTGDDRWRRYGVGSGNGNLPDGELKCIAKDKDGFIWAGTSNGIAVFQCTQDVFTADGCEAIWPVVRNGSLAGYLFNGEEVRSIAVDGANRKWVATSNGCWLISANGETAIQQFTEANSPLLSNDVKRIAIDGKTGEVYFATDKGICSFKGAATEGAEQNNSVIIYPNPVPPGYDGTIAIKGLVKDAIVKITELSGRLVYQTRALGGQAVWNGRDYNGRRISTGVYLVLVTDDSRKEKTAGRIVFINK